MSSETLIRMANQIATFFESQKPETRVAGVAGHVNDFWDPRMRTELLALIEAGGAGLDPMVCDAAHLIRRPARDAA